MARQGWGSSDGGAGAGAWAWAWAWGGRPLGAVQAGEVEVREVKEAEQLPGKVLRGDLESLRKLHVSAAKDYAVMLRPPPPTTATDSAQLPLPPPQGLSLWVQRLRMAGSGVEGGRGAVYEPVWPPVEVRLRSLDPPLAEVRAAILLALGETAAPMGMVLAKYQWVKQAWVKLPLLKGRPGLGPRALSTSGNGAANGDADDLGYTLAMGGVRGRKKGGRKGRRGGKHGAGSAAGGAQPTPATPVSRAAVPWNLRDGDLLAVYLVKGPATAPSTQAEAGDGEGEGEGEGEEGGASVDVEAERQLAEMEAGIWSSLTPARFDADCHLAARQKLQLEKGSAATARAARGPKGAKGGKGRSNGPEIALKLGVDLSFSESEDDDDEDDEETEDEGEEEEQPHNAGGPCDLDPALAFE
jgi:hypothetical protein